MNVDQIVHFTAGTMMLASIGLGLLVHPYWFAVGALVGFNLAQSAFTTFCPLASVLRRVGVPDHSPRC